MQPDKTVPTPENQIPVIPEKPATIERPQPTSPVEQAQGVGASAVPTNPPAQPASATPATANPAATTPVDPSLAQLPAEDADVIEKEWVDKSDEIIESKKDDPRAEDDAQHNLSKAYLKKRFNLDVD